MLAPALDIGDFLQHTPKCIALWLMTFVPPALLFVTTPRTSILRWLWLPCFLALAHALCVQLFTATLFGGFRIPCAALAINALTVVFIFFTIERPGPEDMAEAGIFRSGDSIARKVLGTLGRFYNFRAVGTKWQVKRVPAHPRYLERRRGKDGKIPLRTYLLRQAFIFAWEYLLMDLTFAMSVTQPPEEMDAMVGDASEYHYRDLTPEEWQGRITIGWISWLTSARAVIDMYYRITSIFVLSLGLSSVDIWPPLFRSMADVYTIRGFWSTFWHQYLRWPLTSFSNFITRRVLRLPTPSILERYLNVFLVFLGSGALHVLIDYYDPQVSSSTFPGTMAFFSSFALAVMIEDGVQAFWRCVTGSGPRKEDAPVPLWHKLVGYAWVTTVFMLVTPWFMYPKVRLPPDMSAFVPVLLTPHIGLPAVGGLLAIGAPIVLFGLGGEI
ncbi:hypothetical protein NLU13_5780 [Sarocladium strictum]|uniref:Wax synthase domain-containing protein n=1 Tax=Sarocladium strictum TaxID=5046 RepID=A0AA39L7Z7_SARSR|nr:hypothetical protein NLU13_5780 [Sarocladium strictum]